MCVSMVVQTNKLLTAIRDLYSFPWRGKRYFNLLRAVVFAATLFSSPIYLCPNDSCATLSGMFLINKSKTQRTE